MRTKFNQTKQRVLILCVAIVSAIGAQAQFHAEIDFRYGLGLSENVIGTDISIDKDLLESYNLSVSGLYEATPQIWAGIGINMGVGNYSVLDLSTTPITLAPLMQFTPFATVKYRPFVKHLNAYLFTDIGYSVPFKNARFFSEGFMWNIGVGYSWMFFKHFGLNASIGYNLLQIKGISSFYTDPVTNEVKTIEANNLRHSLGFSIGVVF